MAEDDRVNESEHDESGEDGAGNGRSALMSSLLSKEVLIPAVMSAGAAVAARKGPDLVRGLGSRVERKGEEEAEDLGEATAQGAKKGLTGGGGGLGIGKVASKVIPGRGGDGGGKGVPGKTRRLPIQRWTDVAVPVETAYREWSNLENFPNFMHRVLRVKQEDENKVEWDEKIWFSRRHWEGEVTDRRPNDRIAWKTTSGMQHAGIVSFHQIGPRLTRVMVTMDFVPQGVIEKMASGMRFVKRAVQADLARFKAYVELADAEGLEYKSAAKAKQEEEDKKERSDDSSRGQGSEQRAEQEREAGERRDTSADDRSNDERDEERRERENRRRERREGVGSPS